MKVEAWPVFKLEYRKCLFYMRSDAEYVFLR